MHNGLRIFVDSHYGSYNTEIIRRLHGHHEPQEERAFFEVLRTIRHGGTIMELGSFWAYYSLWFLTVVPESKAILVEPLESSLHAGQKNFELNQRKGVFVRAAIDEVAAPESKVELWPGMAAQVERTTVDALMTRFGLRRLDLLHADIQGTEVRMLNGAASALAARAIEWLFISTHGENIHQKCLLILRSYGYTIVTQHTPAESYSVDGLIVASAGSHNKIRISKRTSWATWKAKLRSIVRIRMLEPFGLRPQTA